MMGWHDNHPTKVLNGTPRSSYLPPYHHSRIPRLNLSVSVNTVQARDIEMEDAELEKVRRLSRSRTLVGSSADLAAADP